MTEAEKEKLEVSEREDKARKDAEEKARKDAEKDLGEDPTETTEGKPRADKSRKDANEEIPAWADAMMKRMDSMEKDRKDADRPMEAADKARKDAADLEAEKSKVEADRARKDADSDDDKDREDRARKDAQTVAHTRQLEAKIAEMDKRINSVYTEASIEDRNAIAETRSRADGLFQSLTGQPASAAQPGESPIAYRKRMADGLRKYSERMKDVRVDSLTGEAFAVIEDHIYTDAQAAIRSDAIVPPGQLRSVIRMDRGHEITEYVGDAAAAWAPFSMGAVQTISVKNPTAH